jgi:hypothetical protein
LLQALQRLTHRPPSLSVCLNSIQIISGNGRFVNPAYILVADPFHYVSLTPK